MTDESKARKSVGELKRIEQEVYELLCSKDPWNERELLFVMTSLLWNICLGITKGNPDEAQSLGRQAVDLAFEIHGDKVRELQDD